MNEVDYYPSIVEFFVKKDYFCKTGINWADITCYKKNIDELIAVEVKLSRVRNAIGQALYNLNWCDKSYVACTNIDEIDMNNLKVIGIGLLKLTKYTDVDDALVEEVIEPKRSTIMNLTLKDTILQRLMPFQNFLKARLLPLSYEKRYCYDLTIHPDDLNLILDIIKKHREITKVEVHLKCESEKKFRLSDKFKDKVQNFKVIVKKILTYDIDQREN